MDQNRSWVIGITIYRLFTMISLHGSTALEQVKLPLYPMFPISERALLFGRFPGFARLSFWQEERIDKDKYGKLLE
jgi:hypothetical protein